MINSLFDKLFDNNTHLFELLTQSAINIRDDHQTHSTSTSLKQNNKTTLVISHPLLGASAQPRRP